MTLFTAVGLVLSVGALFLLLALLQHWWRYERCLGRDIRFPHRLLRWAWPVLLVCGFVVGVLRAVPVLERTERSGAAASWPEGELAAQTRASELRLPFYAEEASVHLGFDGTLLPGGVRSERLQLPWPFLAVALLYLLLVARPLSRQQAPDPG